VLDTIPGVGPTIRTNLLKALGSARRVREASVAELASVPKVTPKLAQRLYDHFHPEGRGEESPAERPEPAPRFSDRGVAHVATGGEVNPE
jgi:excinuclease ABC subunit C